MTTNKHSISLYHRIMPAILQGIAWPLGRFAVHFFTHLTIEGKENLVEGYIEAKRKGTGIILAVNHTHELDFLFPLVGIPPHSPLFPMFYVAKKRASYATDSGFGLRRFIYGFPAFLTSWGAHPFVVGQKDYTKSMTYHEALLCAGKTVCIFPSGKIKKDGAERIMHGGAAYLAEATNAIIVPVNIQGADQMGMADFFLRKRHVTVSYGTPVDVKKVINQNEPISERYKNATIQFMSGTNK